MGITRIANITGLDHIGIPIVLVYRPNARCLSCSQGKGLDLDDVKASGVMEGVELFHGEFIDKPLLFETFANLRRHVAVADVDALPQPIHSRFGPNRRLFWMEGYDLLNDRPTWVPYELVSTDFRLPRPKRSGCFLQTSNGIAAGNHFLEAMIHAVAEVIEVDAESLWDLLAPAQKRATRINLDTVDDPACRQVLETYREAGIAVSVWNMTTDIGVPAFRCHIVPRVDRLSRHPYAAAGQGCNPSRNIALLRALLEAAQGRLTGIAGSRDDITRSVYAQIRRQRVLDYLRAEAKDKHRHADFRRVPTFEGDTLNEDLNWLIARLRAIGIRQVIAVDLSKPEFQIPVVRIVVPGLEGLNHGPDYAPGPRARMRVAATA